MSTRHRSSRPSATPVGSRNQAPLRGTQHIAPLPPYAVPTAPLNQKATTALERLPAQSQYARKLKDLQDKAIEYLTNSATTINERTKDRKDYAIKLQERARRLEQGQSSQTQPSSQRNEDANADDPEVTDQHNQAKKRKAMEDSRQEDIYASEFQRKATAATDQTEEKVRDIIDLKARSEARQKALSEVSGNVVRGEGRVAPTQSTLGASQFRTQADLDDNDEEGDNAPTSVLNSLKRKVDEQDQQYNAMTMRARYAQHNDYVGFKGSVHEAIHQDDGTRLPHHTQWFPAEPGDNDDVRMGGTGSPDDGADSDIEIAREVISTKCPLTMAEMHVPLTSPCNHNFEASAIKEMINLSTVREEPSDAGRRRGGDKIICCPTSGCSVKFTEKELRVDRIMRRRIERAQERARLAAEESLVDDGLNGASRPRALSVHDDGSMLSTAPPVKPEPRSSAAARHVSAVLSTPAISRSGMDMDGADDDDDDDDDDEYFDEDD